MVFIKNIIKGKVYNTETAEKMGCWDNGYPVSDFHYTGESLYKKKTGEFFLYGVGGALSYYSSHSGWGEKIKPLTLAEAKEWAEEKLATDEYEEMFGEVSKDDRRTMIAVSLTASEAELLKRKAQEEGMSVSAFVVLKCLE